MKKRYIAAVLMAALALSLGAAALADEPGQTDPTAQPVQQEETLDVGQNQEQTEPESKPRQDIPQPEQEKIFRKFYQADESHSSEGNGIGLAIVKRVTELHCGTIAVRSGNDETTFTVTLPEHCEEGGKRI